ncbi:MAG: hypothetical protein ACI4RJ_00840 [Alphaproteobacteria bacterium]
MVQKLRRIEKYFLLMFLSLVTFWRGDAEAKTITICCDDNESDETCCLSAGYQWNENYNPPCFDS